MAPVPSPYPTGIVSIGTERTIALGLKALMLRQLVGDFVPANLRGRVRVAQLCLRRARPCAVVDRAGCDRDHVGIFHQVQRDRASAGLAEMAMDLFRTVVSAE